MKKGIYNLIDSTSLGHKAMGDRRFRVSLFTGASLLWNLIYGIYNGALGALYGSTWFGVLCAYYLALCVMRFSVMPRRTRKSKESHENRLMIFNGGALILLAFVLSFIVFVSISDSVQNAYNKIAMIGIATYTFYMAILAIVNSVKAHREKSPFLIIVRNISAAASTASMMSLERSMISTFSDRDAGYGVIMDACVGAGGFLLVLLLGISLMTMGIRREKKENAQATENAQAIEKEAKPD